VAHDGAAWLPRVMDALAKQTRPVQRVVAVDTGSADRSGSMLAHAFGRPAVFGMERTASYGAAVAKALRHRSANAHVPLTGTSREDRTEWVWLLHDDSEPAPDALQRLLAGAREAPQAAVFGPKIMDWSDRDILLEAGTTIDRAGRRVTGIEPREVDQGQHDGDRDVIAVSSAGMLARRDVWDRGGGFDPGLGLFREGTGLCWRGRGGAFRGRGHPGRGGLPGGGGGGDRARRLGRPAPRAPGPPQRPDSARREPAARADAVRAGGQPGAVGIADDVFLAGQAPLGR